MSRSTLISSEALAAFKANLMKRTLDQHDDIALDLGDAAPLDFDEPMPKSAIPTALPVSVRDALWAKVVEARRAAKEIQDAFDLLADEAYALYEKREEARMAALPKCKECGHTLPAKPRKTARKGR